MRGSWLNLSPVVALHTTAPDIHLVSHATGMHAPLALIPSQAGSRVDTVISVDPSALVWDCGDGASVRATFESTSVLRIMGAGAELQIADASDGLTPFTGSYFYQDPTDGSYVFTSYESGRRYRVGRHSWDSRRRKMIDRVSQMTSVESLSNEISKQFTALDSTST